jgi:nitroreductase
MTGTTQPGPDQRLSPPAGQQPSEDVRLTPDDVTCLVAAAARAPSVHNSQPWQFRVRGSDLELHADPRRMLPQVDPEGREMLISCGAALYGLRLGMRRLGYLPDVGLLPDPAQPALIARVRPGARERTTAEEWDLIAAVPHRHTHRGPFAPGRVPSRLLDALVRDAAAEGAGLYLVSQRADVRELARLTEAASRAQLADPGICAELRKWTRPAASGARDGVPARAWADPSWHDESGPEEPAHQRLPQRDFGLAGGLPAGGPLPSATAVLTTAGDSPADWLAAGQALDRLLLRAAARWVFASLQSQALESPALRAQVRDRLQLDGWPQMLLQFGRANVAPATARRPAAEIIDQGRAGP